VLGKGYFILRYINILNVKISVVDLRRACSFIEECIKQKRKIYVCIAPVATIVDCQRDNKYLEIVNGAGMVTPDGMPLVWIGKLKGEKSIGRTYGPDLMLSFSEISQQKNYRHYFYGGTPEAGCLLVERLKNRFPGLNVVGSYAPALRPIGAIEEDAVIDQINKAGPDVLWVGLGSPKQDYWMRDHRQRLDVPVIIGVGAAFDFLAGLKKQAPAWMRRCGLEWFFRLCCEPRRLWRRYLFGNTQFIYFLVKDVIKKKPCKP